MSCTRGRREREKSEAMSRFGGELWDNLTSLIFVILQKEVEEYAKTAVSLGRKVKIFFDFFLAFLILLFLGQRDNLYRPQ
jgi:hypothetical protein